MRTRKGISNWPVCAHVSSARHSKWVLTVRVRRLSWRVTIIPLRHFIIRKQSWLIFIPFCLPAFARCTFHQYVQLFLLPQLMCKLSYASSVPSFRRCIFTHLISSHTDDKCLIIFPLLSSPLLSCPVHIQCRHVCVSRNNGNQPIVMNCTVVPTVLFIHMYMHVNWGKFT